MSCKSHEQITNRSDKQEKQSHLALLCTMWRHDHLHRSCAHTTLNLGWSEWHSDSTNERCRVIHCCLKWIASENQTIGIQETCRASRHPSQLTHRRSWKPLGVLQSCQWSTTVGANILSITVCLVRDESVRVNSNARLEDSASCFVLASFSTRGEDNLVCHGKMDEKLLSPLVCQLRGSSGPDATICAKKSTEDPHQLSIRYESLYFKLLFRLTCLSSIFH